MEDTFKKNPSREALEDDLNLINRIIWEKNQGNNVTIKDGMVTITDKSNYQSTEIGTLTDLAALTEELFGEDIPNGVEYMTLGGVTFMTYYGHLLACGDGSGLHSSRAVDLIRALNNALANDVIQFMGNVWDNVTGTDVYSNVTEAAAMMEKILEVLSQGDNYDNALEILYNLAKCFGKMPGSSDVIKGYIGAAKIAELGTLVGLLLTELECNGDVMMEWSDKKDENVQIPWEEGGAGAGSGSVGVRQLCNTSLSAAQWATLIYNYFRDSLSAEDIAVLKEYGVIVLDIEGMTRASKAIQYDPLIIDLNKNNLYSTTLQDGTYYDYGEDGMKEKTAWADRGDGFLVYDRNGDGTIDHAGEFFGDKTLLADGTYAENGFLALAQYDENGDGVIDGTDTIFSKLAVWQDANGNGITEEGELKSLSELGIVDIEIAQGENRYTDESGNTVIAESVVHMEDGSTQSVGAMAFEIDSVDTQLENEIEISDAVRLFMPNLKGCGNVLTLHQAMMGNRKLYNLVADYINVRTAEERDVICEQILLEWTGCSDIEDGSRGRYIKASHLAVIEAFYGKGYVGMAGSTPTSLAGPILENVYQKLLLDVKSSLLLQTFGALCTLYAPIEKNPDTGEATCNLQNAVACIDRIYQDAHMVYDVLNAYARYALESGVSYESLNTPEINAKLEEIGFSDIDILLGNTVMRAGDATLVSGSRIDDIIYAGSQSTTLFGGEGNDRLYGGGKDDMLIGGVGDDYLSGGLGADTYIYSRGDGNDIISNWDFTESRSYDRLVFGDGILADEIGVQRVGNNLILTDQVTGQTVTVQDMYKKQDMYLENIEFLDGTVWTREDVQEKISVIQGSGESEKLSGYDSAYGCSGNETIYAGSGDDTVYAYGGDDVLYGEDGSDKLYGGKGNDVLVGGAGDDYLEGGEGADSYIYNRGDGNDTISNIDSSSERLNDRLIFGEGILPEEIGVKRDGSDLILTDRVTGQTIKILNAYSMQRNYLENIEFADGTVWKMEDVREMLTVIHGSEESEKISGYDSAYGCTGNETIYAGAGDDTVYANGGDDVVYGEDGDDRLHGNAGNDILYGGAGNDQLDGGIGDDILIGGAGDDYLSGGSGSDTYIYNRGDGNDHINNWVSNESGVNDRLLFGEGILAEEVSVKRSGNNLLLTDTVTGQTVKIQDAFKQENWYLANIEFADGTVWKMEDIREMLTVIYGSDASESISGYNSAYGCTGNETIYAGAGNDTVYSYGGDDVVYGEDGDDQLYGGAGNDMLYGGNGKDKLYGDSGDDILVGGAGDDYLAGGDGSDIYIYNCGDGNDIIATRDNDGGIDTLVMGAESTDLKFERQGKHLIISLLDQEGSVTIQNWYSGDQYQMDVIQTSDGCYLERSQVDLLIQAMASFESSSGLSWQDAARLQEEQVAGIAEQYWVRQVG